MRFSSNPNRYSEQILWYKSLEIAEPTNKFKTQSLKVATWSLFEFIEFPFISFFSFISIFYRIYIYIYIYIGIHTSH
jgi:hypothetical protein